VGVFEETVVKAKEVIDKTGKKAGEVIAVQKLKVNAASITSQIAKDYEAIGRLTYDGIKKDSQNTEAIDAIVREIDEKLEQLDKIQEEIAQTKGSLACVRCGCSNSIDSAFCRKCGARLTDDGDDDAGNSADA
jgi:ribosomal protein L40E